MYIKTMVYEQKEKYMQTTSQTKSYKALLKSAMN